MEIDKKLIKRLIDVLEDLKKCRDLNYIYNSRKIDNDKVNKLTLILHNIHITSAHKNYPTNLTLRKLNHDHIFVLPFLKDNGLHLNNIQEGLEELAKYESPPKLPIRGIRIGIPMISHQIAPSDTV